MDSLSEIAFGTLAGSASQWNRASRLYIDVYCHGNFNGGKRTNAPVWISSTQAWGTCHDVGGNPDKLLWKHELHVQSLGLT